MNKENTEREEQNDSMKKNLKKEKNKKTNRKRGYIIMSISETAKK